MTKSEWMKLDNRNLTEEARKIAETLDMTDEDFEEMFKGVDKEDYDNISKILVGFFGEE